jgi:hypothetical protein
LGGRDGEKQRVLDIAKEYHAKRQVKNIFEKIGDWVRQA